MSTDTERYVLLGLGLGRHVEGLVDAYFGPPELAQRVAEAAPLDPAELVSEADGLLVTLDDGWLADQVRGLRTYAGVLAGERTTYAAEVEGCYGVRPKRVAEAAFAEAQEHLGELLPGDGPLVDRYEAWRASMIVPRERVARTLAELVAVLRSWTSRGLGLPEGEELTTETVTDEPWLAFNYYLGDLRSRIVVNVELPITALELLELAAHEAYPGHHTERAWKEQLLVRELGLLEESIILVPAPQALVTEGIAETAVELLDADGRDDAAEVVRRLGFDFDVERALALREARAPLRHVSVQAALMLHDDGVTREESQAYIERWAAVRPEYAAKSIDFLTDPTWRAYAMTYAYGGELCRAFHRNEPARYRRLLTEQIRVDDLVASASGEAGVSSGT